MENPQSNGLKYGALAAVGAGLLAAHAFNKTRYPNLQTADGSHSTESADHLCIKEIRGCDEGYKEAILLQLANSDTYKNITWRICALPEDIEARLERANERANAEAHAREAHDIEEVQACTSSAACARRSHAEAARNGGAHAMSSSADGASTDSWILGGASPYGAPYTPPPPQAVSARSLFSTAKARLSDISSRILQGAALAAKIHQHFFIEFTINSTDTRSLGVHKADDAYFLRMEDFLVSNVLHRQEIKCQVKSIAVTATAALNGRQTDFLKKFINYAVCEEAEQGAGGTLVYHHLSLKLKSMPNMNSHSFVQLFRYDPRELGTMIGIDFVRTPYRHQHLGSAPSMEDRCPTIARG